MTDEFDIINRYLRTRSISRQDIDTGIGDDAAILNPRQNENLVVSADTLVEHVHFKADIRPEWIGHKSLAVNLSDMAAMGAEPAWATLALTLPHIDENWISGFCAGFFALADKYQVALIGGDITEGPLSVTVNIMGYVPPGNALKRNGAEAGDAVLVTGCIGDAGLAWLAGGNQVKLSQQELAACAERLHRPWPRVEAGLALRGIATAAIDISDGLLADLMHLLEASQTGARIDIDKVPVSQILSERLNRVEDWLQPLTSGDDYELLFCVPERYLAELYDRFQDIECPVTQIGVMEQTRGLRCYFNQNAVNLPLSLGYRHFA